MIDNFKKALSFSLANERMLCESENNKLIIKGIKSLIRKLIMRIYL